MDIHIYYHDIEVDIISNLKVGDKILYKGKNRTVTGFSHCRSIDGVFVDFKMYGKRYSVSFSIIQADNTSLQITKYKTSIKDAKLYKQKISRNIGGVICDDSIFQFVFTLPNGSKYYRQPFSLRYLWDRKHYTDWPEWDIPGLTNPKEVDFTIEDGIVTSITDKISM